MEIPIAILSFNRPHYLSQVLDSLAAQTGLNDRPVFLFQDNAVNAYSGIRYADDETIRECVEIFEKKLPGGTVFLAEQNLCSCENYLRAEEFVFNTLGAEVAYFFEDDMVLSPHYLTMMDRIYGFVTATEKVGYFAAYGAHAASLEHQRARASAMGRMGYQWAFGLTRRHWSELRDWLEPYYRFVLGRDYRLRPRRHISAHYQAQGYPLKWSSQDHAKKVGTYALGRVSINTIACFGKNIGEEGLTFTPKSYQQGGFEGALMYPEPVELTFPSAGDLERLHASGLEIQWRRINADHPVQGPAPERIRSGSP